MLLPPIWKASIVLVISVRRLRTRFAPGGFSSIEYHACTSAAAAHLILPDLRFAWPLPTVMLPIPGLLLCPCPGDAAR
jgi:hypothetical protein